MSRRRALWATPYPPNPKAKSNQRTILWAQVAAGAELDENDVVHVLDAPTWQRRRRQLEELGGSPPVH
jgi:hypothetical protein